VKASVVVREYAWLTTDPVDSPSLDQKSITRSAFGWLCQLNAAIASSGATLIQDLDGHWLKLDNYVGVVECPCGTRIEILPKHYETEDSVAESRSLLRKMLRVALDLPSREVGSAHLELFNAPLSEWIIHQFLFALDHLIKTGIQFDYHRIEEEQRFLRGQLNTVRQIRLSPARQHRFEIRHDIFEADRPENRLLKSALDRVIKSTRVNANWQLAFELKTLLVDLPSSRDVKKDFENWKHDRLTAHYRRAKPWCELILNRQTPIALVGEWEGMSLLFPMEKLFERYVASCLRKSLADGAQLKMHPLWSFLCTHDGGKIFRLEPDFLIERAAQRWILDAKWKRLDGGNKVDKYGLQQSDFYQLFAYGQAYLREQKQKHLVLIYPKSAKFSQSLPVFNFSDEAKLWVIPFDLETGQLEHLAGIGLPLTGVSDQAHSAQGKVA